MGVYAHTHALTTKREEEEEEDDDDDDDDEEEEEELYRCPSNWRSIWPRIHEDRNNMFYRPYMILRENANV